MLSSIFLLNWQLPFKMSKITEYRVGINNKMSASDNSRNRWSTKADSTVLTLVVISCCCRVPMWVIKSKWLQYKCVITIERGV